MTTYPIERKAQRFNTSLLVRLDGENLLRECRGNVSAGGFCFESDVEIEPGTMIELLVRLPGAGIWIQGQGVVLGIATGGDSLGIRGRFTEIEPGEPDLFGQWLQSIQELPSQTRTA